VKRALLLAALLLAGATSRARADDGYDLWLRYRPVADRARWNEYRAGLVALVIQGDSPTLRAASDELTMGLRRMLGADLLAAKVVARDGAVVIGTPAGSPIIASLGLARELSPLGSEGFLIRAVTVNGKRATVIAANSDVGALYGAFRLLRELQLQHPIAGIAIASAPRVKLRMLDHWDNLDGSVERGYAGRSLWEWEQLPGTISPRYRDYARANASVGINGSVLTNVNANAKVLSPEYLAKAAAIADVFRPYGIRVYLTARFSAPIELGGLGTADPLDPQVRDWWKRKSEEIYAAIPDFGGLLVKANSEGQPGPQDYKRTHADGANMLADAVASHGGIVMWRAFVYSNTVPVDRVMQAYDEFVPLDGRFRPNVLVQVKSGALDFQPREPFHPLFGAMPKTPLMMELQITKEYLGQDTHLVFLGPYWEEVLRADTWRDGKGSTVARVVDGSLHGYTRTGIAGVANIGTDRDWTGSIFNQANWYAFGRLAWDPMASSGDIADEWIRMTLSNDSAVVAPVRRLMLASREAVVNYMTPLGLAHIMATGHHYGPGAWATAGRPDWTPAYYHRADSIGLGFDRTALGSNGVGQYAGPARDRYANRSTVPDSVLLWFHHVKWGDTLASGRTLWNELAHRYNAGVDSVRSMQRAWDGVHGKVDDERYRAVREDLAIQEREARWWRDATLQYFQTFSRMPLPSRYEKPAHPLEYYMRLKCPPNPSKPRCEGIP
jgi:alpha-glucuronidase